MKHSHLLGSLPTRKSGMLNRLLASKQLNISYEELHKGYNNWCQIFRMPDSTLTLEQYFTKMDEAGISAFNLGNRVGSYNLSRFNDEGPYTNESCRFIKTEANLREQKRVNPFQRIVDKYGYEKAIQMNSNNAIKGWKRRIEKGTNRFAPRTLEHRKKLSESMKNRKFTEEHKRNISLGMKKFCAEKRKNTNER